MQNLATQKVVDIRIIKGRRQEDIDAEVARRLKIRALAEKEYKTFIDGAKAALERATKRFGSLPLDSKEKAAAAVAALSKEAAFTINEWIHLVGNFCSSADSPVTKACIGHFKNEYDAPSAHRAVIEGCGFEYNKTKGLPLRDLVPEVSIERQMLTLMGEGWSMQGSLSSSSNSNDVFFQTMVKYEEVAAAAPTLGLRRVLEN